MVLMVFLSSRISPRASTVIFCDRSPLATAVVTFAMLRTCAVRFAARPLTLSVRSFHVPETPLTFAWPPSLPSVPTSFATRVTSAANELSWSTILLMTSLIWRISPLTSTVIFCVRSPLAIAVVTFDTSRSWTVRFEASALTLSVRSFHVPETPLTSACPPSFPFGADLLRDARDLRGERAERVDHRVDRVLELVDLAARVDRDLLRQVAVGDGGRDLGDVADLGGEVGGEAVDVVGEVLPRAGDALDVGLSAELSLGTDFLRDARDLGRERRELIDHDVDGVLQLEDLALARRR